MSKCKFKIFRFDNDCVPCLRLLKKRIRDFLQEAYQLNYSGFIEIYFEYKKRKEDE